MKHYALLLIIMSLVFFTRHFTKPTGKNEIYFPTNIPHSENCQRPYKEIILIRPEYGIPVSKKITCKYDKSGLLTEVNIYNYEKGFQGKKPVRTVNYEWYKRTLKKIFIFNHLVLADRPHKEIITLIN